MTDPKVWCVMDADTGETLAVAATESAARSHADRLGGDHVVRPATTDSPTARLLGIRHDIIV